MKIPKKDKKKMTLLLQNMLVAASTLVSDIVTMQVSGPFTMSDNDLIGKPQTIVQCIGFDIQAIKICSDTIKKEFPKFEAALKGNEGLEKMIKKGLRKDMEKIDEQ